MEERKQHLFGKGLAIGICASFVLFAFLSAMFVIIFIGNFSGGKTVASKPATPGSEITGSDTSDSKLATLQRLINYYYYQDVSEDVLKDGMYSGMVNALGDKYSGYYNEEDFTQLMIDVNGDYSGIGALLQKNPDNGEVSITKVYRGTPAEKAGLKDGDLILSADGFDSKAEELDLFVRRIRGAAGTEVEIKVQRGDKELSFTCKRDKVIVPSVEYQMLPNNIGYIEISQFANNTATDFKKAMEDLTAKGMKSVIFDLRGNGGGLLDTVTEMLDYLLPEGNTVYIIDKYGNRENFKSDAKCVKMPMVVLTSANTASASEIFAGAIRDYNYGTLIGTKTFGKGIVQSTIPLGDGSALKLTTATYYTPSGECIHGVGITPDIELEYKYEGSEDEEYSIEKDNQVNKAIEVLSKN